MARFNWFARSRAYALNRSRMLVAMDLGGRVDTAGQPVWAYELGGFGSKT